MFASAAGHSTLGIPKKVGEEFTESDPGGKLPARAKDLAPEKFAAIKRGLEFLREFFTEEEAEPEHAAKDEVPALGGAANSGVPVGGRREGEDANWEEGKHPRNQGKFSSAPGGSGRSSNNESRSSKKIDYANRPPLAFHKDRPGTAHYIVNNGTIRPYEKGDLLDSVGSLLEYKIDVKHSGVTKTTGRVEDHGDGHFVFVSDVDKMQPVPYKMEEKPTPESVEKQSGFDFAIKKGKKGGDFKHIQEKSVDFSDGYREGLRALADEPKEKIKEYQDLISGNQARDDASEPVGRAASLAFVTKDGKALLLKRADDESNYPGTWAFPGGKLDEGEDFEDAALREAREECGEDCLNGVVRPEAEDARSCLKALDQRRTPFGWDHATFALPVEDEFEPTLNKEHSDHAWVYPDELPEKTHPGVRATIEDCLKGGEVKDESVETKERHEGKLSERTHQEIGRVGSPKREDMAGSEFLLSSEKKYPIKKSGKYDRSLLLAAAKEARMHGRGDLAKRADAIRAREFPEPAKDGMEQRAVPGGGRGPMIRFSPVDKREARLAGVTRGQERGQKTRVANIAGFDMAMDWSGNVALDVKGSLPGVLAFDKDSTRKFDADGRMHVDQANISKANVCEYLGKEIPDAQKLGLDPEKKYRLYRDPEELKKAVKTFNQIPILSKHVPVDADTHPAELVVGSTGTDADFGDGYLKNSLVFWPRKAIDEIESNRKKQLSAGYRYRADPTPGVTPEGEPYDMVMRDIVGNHLAQVVEGRAGPDVVVGDAAPIRHRTEYALHY
jgi:8-oxo-dGTP pyrophosphatase MutT (NUDIX family)